MSKKMWATVIDDKTKKCKVGIGTDEELYKKLGMRMIEVDQALDGNYYIKGYAPTTLYVPETQKQIEKLKKELEKYDYIGIKIATGCATIEEYKDEIELCKKLREEINKLEKVGE